MPALVSRTFEAPPGGGVRRLLFPLTMRSPTGKGLISSSVASKLYSSQFGLKICWPGYTQVIDVHVKHRDRKEASIRGILEVKRGSPVVTLVCLDQGRGAGRVEQGVIFHAQVEVTPSLDSVHMAGCSAGANNGIHPALGERTLTIEVVHGEGSRVFGRCYREQASQMGGYNFEKHIGSFVKNNLGQRNRNRRKSST